ncbi:CDP-alcohol phosphatidyltransferase family protein [Dietzia aurantiaca]|uniref:CDP-alcohol phosphatidyltransferase family protein n=1 Tax=Dietzia aurantiaca TaxID=983873 RepID=UPI001E28B5FF|nr:CDP-alcohol phosphatidyltransferase family protein [Dietzia aurantiaca]MCD2261980.1 CDP-alcohol phosphatidyltransferase family protein [Dietzia aurantiaca]
MSAARDGRRETDLREWRTGEGKVLGAKIPPPRGGHLSAAVPPGLGAEVSPREKGVSDRFWTLPNAISLCRIALIPVLVVAVLVWDAPTLALWVLGVVVVSDWLDGKIARLWNMRSTWGEKLDPIADRILVAVVPVTFVIAGYIPLWVVVVLLVRDALLLVTLPVYRRRGLEPEVTYLGKAATFALFWSLPLILAGNAGVVGAAGLEVVGEACLYWGVGLYVWSGGIYVWQARRTTVALPARDPGSTDVRAPDGV